MDDRQRKEAGRIAERAALEHLSAAGLQLVACNYRCKAGEIDLVMLDGGTLALIEVRYRASRDFGGAAASVTWRKQHRIANAARHLLQTKRELQRYPARFDVIAISPSRADAERGVEIDWIKSAFTL